MLNLTFFNDTEPAKNRIEREISVGETERRREREDEHERGTEGRTGAKARDGSSNGISTQFLEHLRPMLFVSGHR